MFTFKQRPGHGLCHVRGCRNPHYKRSRLCCKHMKQKWRAEHPVHAAWRNLQDSARKRRIPFTLTIIQFIEFAEATAYVDHKGVTKLCLHCDRIDPERGYEWDNIQVLTCSENSAKDNRKRYVKFYQQQQPECPF